MRAILPLAGLAATSLVAPLILPPAVPSAAAQGNPTISNVVPESAAVTIHAKITALNPKTRAVTLRGRDGSQVTVTAGPAVRLQMLKVGDTVNAKYYRSVGFVVVPPSGGSGTPAPADDELAQVIARPAQAPGGVAIRVTKVTGTVVGIDLASNSVEVVNPSGGGIYTVEVTDPARVAMLPNLKVGDTITAVISETLAVSIEPAKKSWF
jgi:Cu/Ag efflux protein CusF